MQWGWFTAITLLGFLLAALSEMRRWQVLAQQNGRDAHRWRKRAEALADRVRPEDWRSLWKELDSEREGVE